jgi:hypothetical protein
MGPFFVAFWISFCVFLSILVLLRLTVPYALKIFAPRPIASASAKESAEWLNFILYRVLTHFQTPESIEKINQLMTAQIKPHRFRLFAMGSSPVVSHVETLVTGSADDIRILVPVAWHPGPSFDLMVGQGHRISIEVDLVRLQGRILFSWLAKSGNALEIRFDNDFLFDFEISIELWRFIKFSLTRMPLLGPILKGLTVLTISQRVFTIDLPRPELPDEVVQ